MKHFHIHHDDARWLGRWLRGNLCGVLVLAGTYWIVAGHPSSKISPLTADAQDSVTRTDAGIERTPEGWRRTAQGWQHTSTWDPLPRPLGDWIEIQQSREPLWAQRLLAEVRELPPLIFALIQITAITAVIVLTNRRTDG